MGMKGPNACSNERWAAPLVEWSAWSALASEDSPNGGTRPLRAWEHQDEKKGSRKKPCVPRLARQVRAEAADGRNAPLGVRKMR